jgi:alpha-tubulin suppressor-like RCC1 family protein
MNSIFPKLPIHCQASGRPPSRWVRFGCLISLIWLGAWPANRACADTAPTITTAPLSQTVVLGHSATFTVVAGGTAPLSYQWYKGAVAISGATTSSYTVTNAQTADAAAYIIAVSNAAGTVRSFAAFDKYFAASGSHSLFVKADGGLWATGYNGSGQLGDPTTVNYRYLPVQVATGVAAVAAGSNHSAYVRTDGTLWVMGSNSSGQLGDGTTTNRTTPVQIASGAAAVAAGSSHTLYLKNDGTLWGAGYNSSGQLGDGTGTSRLTPVQIAASVKSIAAGNNQSFFIKTDGSLWAMGNNTYGQLGDGTITNRFMPVQIATGVVAVAAGYYHTLFLKDDGSAWGMGYNSNGQLGDGGVYSYYRTSPVKIATDIAAIATGSYHSLLLKNDGTLWAAGSDSSGQFGDGRYNNSYFPLQIAANVRAIAAGDSNTFYLRDDGTLWGTGSNYYGQLGDGSGVSRSTWVPVLCPGDAPAFLTVIVPPAITTQPASLAVLAGGASSLSVAVSGTAPFGYQWYFNGGAITGATSAQLNLSSFSIAKSGDYTVTVTNAAGSVSSVAATLSLSLPLTTTQTAISGKAVAFMATTGGSGTVSWQMSTDNGATWTTLTDDATFAGSDSQLLEIRQATRAMDGSLFRYQVAAGNQTVTSSAAALNLITSPLVMPSGIGLDKAGNIYVTDVTDQTVLKITPDLRLTIVAGKSGAPGANDGIGSEARLNEPGGFMLADDGTMVLADSANATIRTISATGAVTTLAGVAGSTGAADGSTATALFNYPTGLGADLVGNYLVADQANQLVRMISGGRVTTLAGKAGTPGVMDGVGTTASFNSPTGITIRRDTYASITWDGGNNGYGTVFVSDQGSNTIRTILANGQVGTYLGAPSASGYADGSRTRARFYHPTGLAMDGDGNLYVADTGNHTIRKVTTSGIVTTLAGVPTVSGLMDGPGFQALFNSPEGLAVDAARNIYVADTGNAAIRKISPAGVVTTLAIQGNVPVITSQPASLTANVGAPVTFTVSATSEGSMTYRWKKDNVTIAGATGASHTITSVTAADAGSYTVTVANSWGSTPSIAAVLTVNALSTPSTPPTPPTPSIPSTPSAGGGGGGAPSYEFLILLGAAAGLRLFLRRRRE